MSSHRRVTPPSSVPILTKTPRTSLAVQSDKIPRAHDTSWSNYYPSWRVSLLEMVDPFGWHKLDRTEIDYIRGKLAHFETMTLAQIFVESKKQHHAVQVHKLCREARTRLREIGHQDLEELHRLRLTGRERIWGILRCNVIQLLWWDPFHKVCPYDLPNT